MSMNTRPFSVNVAAMVVALAMGTRNDDKSNDKASICIRRSKALHTDEVLLLQRRIQ
jgi:hypothetical protein